MFHCLPIKAGRDRGLILQVEEESTFIEKINAALPAALYGN